MDPGEAERSAVPAAGAGPSLAQDPAALARRYPIAEAADPERLRAEADELDALQRAGGVRKYVGYAKLGGPGFLDAATTLGAGTLTASILSGVAFGYRTLWIVWFAMGIGLFMLAAMARFTCRGGFRVIQEQNRRHGLLIGSVLTALIGTAGVAVVFNAGQYSLGTHLVESLGEVVGVPLPRQWNWIGYTALTTWLVLTYGRSARATRFVETVLKVAIAAMFLSFAACLAVVGIDWSAFFRGMFVPWLPGGREGIDLFIAASAAAVGVMDWVLFQYAGLVRGWGPKHEGLARFDLGFGLFLPFVLINAVVVAVFAETLHPTGIRPETAPELAAALVPLLGNTWSQVLFYVGFAAVPITTTVGMSIACAMAVHEAFGWEPDPRSPRWVVTALLPQVGFLAVWYPSPIWLVVTIAAFLSLSNNVVGWSMYLLLNDPDVLGEDRSRSWGWNLGIALQITLLNAIAILYVFNRFGMWGE